MGVSLNMCSLIDFGLFKFVKDICTLSQAIGMKDA